MTRSLAIVMARGGSKRIPGKNIRDFLGKPILSYPLAALTQSGCFDAIIVSTDNDQIAQVASELGAKVPFRRSAEAANDFATIADAVHDVLTAYKNLGQQFEFVCCVLGTAALLTSESIQAGLDKLLGEDIDSVCPVVRFSFPPQRALRMTHSKLGFVYPEHISSRSNDLEPLFHDCGMFYWLRVESFFRHRQIFMPNSLGLELPEEEVQDIDNDSDWLLAEMKYKLRQPRK